MERQVTERQHVWFSDTLEETIDVLSFGDDMGVLLEMEPGFVLRVD